MPRRSKGTSRDIEEGVGHQVDTHEGKGRRPLSPALSILAGPATSSECTFIIDVGAILKWMSSM